MDNAHMVWQSLKLANGSKPEASKISLWFVKCSKPGVCLACVCFVSLRNYNRFVLVRKMKFEFVSFYGSFAPLACGLNIFSLNLVF
jgi:hypothetical protein